MSFKKSRKTLSNYVGSVESDLNDIVSKIGGTFGSIGNLSNSFDQRISDGLSDLLTGATGIRTSNIPEISSEVLDMKSQNREARSKALEGRMRGFDTPTAKTKLQFPSDWRTENNESGNMQNYIHFRSLPRKNSEAGDRLYDIFLYVPDAMQDDVSLGYEEGERGLAEAVLSKFFGSGGGVADGSEIKALVLDGIGAGKILKSAAGQTINPMKFQLFQGVNMRTYSYDFVLYPENVGDSEIIREIGYAFKKSALPGTTGGNKRIYTFPNEWAIRYHGPMKNWIDYPMVSVLSDVKVNYAVNGTQRMIDGSPQAVGLSLSFSEVVTLDRDKYDLRVAAYTNADGDRREQTQEGGSAADIRGINQAVSTDQKATAIAKQIAEAKAAEDKT